MDAAPRPGHGNSEVPKPTDDFSLSLLVSDALALLDLVGAMNAHIVGNSAGGYVSQQLAIRHPERVKSLALFGSTPGLKHSHAPTWIPKIKEIGLKQFLADTIDERFDSSADPKVCAIELVGCRDGNLVHAYHDPIDTVITTGRGQLVFQPSLLRTRRITSDIGITAVLVTDVIIRNADHADRAGGECIPKTTRDLGLAGRRRQREVSLISLNSRFRGLTI
jgi:pimeloyl-ACP methyl ester carboxylesterase